MRQTSFPLALRSRSALLAPLLLALAAYGLLLTTEGAAQEKAESVADPAAARSLEQQRHLEQLGVKAWHAAGYRAEGMRVAVIDSGFRGYRAALGKVLPAAVTVRSFRVDGNLEARDSQHGILCAEVIHAIAPAAELLLATWEPGRPDQFLQAVRWAKAQGARIISCSCIMPDWSDGEGGGAVHEVLAGLLGDGEGPSDLLFFAAAGNTAERHWTGLFRAGTDGYHEWLPGRTSNALRPWGTEDAFVELYSRPGSRYEVRVQDQATGQEVVRTTTSGAKDRACTAARFQPEPGSSYAVRVRLLSGPAGRFHLVALHSGLETYQGGGSICFPADGKDVIAVGAVSRDGHRCRYSACGPCPPRPKPDLVARVPFPSVWRATPFSGTSAAAPQAAALGALCWARHPDWPAARVRSALQAAALDLGPPGHDIETGYGLVRVPR
jgi:subtilisin family serine protease